MAADITTTTANVFLPTIWSIETLRATENALVAAGLVKRFDAQVRERGQTINIPNIDNLNAIAYTPNQVITTQYITETQTQLQINKWYTSAFQIEDMVAVQSQYDLRSEYSEKAGYAIAKQVDSDTMSVWTSWTTNSVGQYGNDISDATIVASINTLN